MNPGHVCAERKVTNEETIDRLRRWDIAYAPSERREETFEEIESQAPLIQRPHRLVALDCRIVGQLYFGLLESVSDAAAGQIIRRHFHTDAIAHQNANAVLAHFAGNRGQYDMFAAIKFDFEKCIGLFVYYGALRGDQIISGQ